MLKNLLLSLSFLLIALSSQAQDIAGKAYILSNCASGGMDYYFYEDNIVIAVCDGCEATDLVQSGTWEIEGENVQLRLTEQWEGKPSGNIIPPCGSVCQYDKYTAVYSKINESEEFALSTFSDNSEEEGCESVITHADIIPDPRKPLRNGLVGKYPQTSERLITEADIKGLTKKDLRIMRNEIFARYGYQFKSKDLQDYFKKQEGYSDVLDNVDAFLDEVELKNIEFIKKYEAN
jgi:hypothetical protein